MKRLIGIGIAVVAVLCFLLWFYLRHNERNTAAQNAVNKAVAVDSTDELWFKNSVVYTLDVEKFKDSDGDGIGDFRGLIQRLGYIDSLGVDVIWLAPFQPTPNKDDGYDVSDFYGIDKRLGNSEDFKTFMQKAREKGLRVIMDLVLNHTSTAHPWYQQARKSEGSPYRSWFVWSKERPENYDVGMVFPGVQKETWTYDTLAGAYYYHRFYKFQPDLNAQNPAVQAEVKNIIRYWVDQGLSGFRLDAVPFFIEVPKTKGEEFEHQFHMLTELRTYLRGLKKDAFILGEANVLPEETEPYFGARGDAMHMMFNFFVNQHLFYALATGEAGPLKEALQATADIPKTAQWGQFLRNHDELDLGRLSKKERNKVFDAFGPEEGMQLYDRGIRRRLAPMMNNNRQQLELAYSVLFALPSTPVLRYGDEIGMGDNLALKERESVRTPMQWSADKNAGFSSAEKPVSPVVDTGTYGYRSVQVAGQLADSASLLNWTRGMIRLRRQCPEVAYGSWKILDAGSPNVLAIQYHWQNKNLLVLHNFSREEQNVKLNGMPAGRLQNMQTGKQFGADKDGSVSISLPAYGYCWARPVP